MDDAEWKLPILLLADPGGQHFAEATALNLVIVEKDPAGPLHLFRVLVQVRARFARLTAQEEKHGLLDDPSGIGTREGWARRLAERGFALKGHRLVRSNALRNRQGEQQD